MTSVNRTFTVSARPAAVLEYFRDFARTQEWDPATESTVRVDEGPLIPGATWHNTTHAFGLTSELLWTLSEHAADRLVFVGRNDALTSTDTITVRPTDDNGTEVTYTVDLDLHGLAVLAGPVVHLEAERLSDQAERNMTEILNRL